MRVTAHWLRAETGELQECPSLSETDSVRSVLPTTLSSGDMFTVSS